MSFRTKGTPLRRALFGGIGSDLPAFAAFYPRRSAASGNDAHPDPTTARSPRITPMTDTEFTSMLDDYRSIELRVEVLMSATCTPFCKVCPTPCCRIAICQEAAESPFLLAVHGSRQAFDAKRGYLGATGCTLGAGRPPVCHAFICGRILSQQPDDQRRFALECLGDLVGYLGKQVWMKRHLVEALSDGDLRKANRDTFRTRLTTGAEVMDILESYFARDRDLDDLEIASLAMVRKPSFARG